jgi:hypothetical protein
MGVGGDLGAEGHLKKRMDGDSARIESRYACRSDNDHAFYAMVLQIVEKGGFARNRLAGQKYVFAGPLHIIIGKFELGIFRHGCNK